MAMPVIVRVPVPRLWLWLRLAAGATGGMLMAVAVAVAVALLLLLLLLLRLARGGRVAPPSPLGLRGGRPCAAGRVEPWLGLGSVVRGEGEG